MTDKDIVIGFLKQIGIKTIAHKYDYFGLRPKLKPFLPGIAIKQGNLYYTKLAHIGNILHEAGHIAVTPSKMRKYLNGYLAESRKMSNYISNLYPDSQEYKMWTNGDEQAAQAWSYAVCVHLGIDSMLPFENGFESEREGEEVWQSLRLSHGHTMGFHAGISSLFHGGMLEKKSDFPNLQRWVQL